MRARHGAAALQLEVRHLGTAGTFQHHTEPAVQLLHKESAIFGQLGQTYAKEQLVYNKEFAILEHLGHSNVIVQQPCCSM